MWAIQVALALCVLAPSAGHFFEDGYSHHYTYTADNSLFDQHNVTTILKVHINTVNVTEEGHRVHSLHVDSLVQYVKDGVLLDNPMHWDLTKTFLFVSEGSGQIRVVHCHPEDHEELLVIKKAMVSIFSVHVQIEEDKDKWSYTADERDHLGALSHQYTAQRMNTGLKLHRQHYSANEAFRTHEKTLLYDHGGTLQEALAKDHVLVRDRSPKQKPSVLPGEKPHKVVSSGDFPAVQASATVKVTLDGKRLNQGKKADVFHNLTAQNLETRPKPKPSHSLENVRQNISMVFQCLKQFPQPDNENRSICINNLRAVLHSLHKQDYIHFVNSYLGNRCRSNDTSCEDRRLVVIDVVSRLGDVTSQELLVTHVLTKEPAVGEELRRVFIHAVALDKPTEAFILALEKLCFGARGEHEGSRNLTRSQSRACLAVGGVARRCVGSGQHATADRLVNRLENWLDLHAAGDHHVSKRDTWLEEIEHEDHHMSKAVLLHALGNAALPRSRRHLLLHAAPNRGHQLWRRAALDAMRHYNCSQTVQSLLAAMKHDEKHTVRQTALSVYVKHPRRHEVYRVYENDLLSTNYTYPSVARVKRSVFDKILARFVLALPTLDWKKELGSQAVGASFGLYFENGIEGMFRVLDGHVKVTVHDKVWAEIHLGIINKKWDILLAEVCYKGQLSYNMNIMKNFLKGKSEAAASAFDKIAGPIVEPIEKIVNDLASKYQDAVTKQPKSGFDLLAQAVQALPEKAKQALQSTVDLSQAVDGMGGLPSLSKLQQLAARAQALMEDVQTEATDLFSNIKEAAVVALPFAEKEIRTALNTVLGKLGKVKDHPRQVFASVERSKMSFSLAMQRILESSSIIKQTTGFFSGSRSSFMNTASELSDLVESARHVVQKLRVRGRVRGKGQVADTWTDTEEHLGAQMDAQLQKLLSLVDAMTSQLESIKNGAKDLQAGLDRQTQYIDALKAGYQAFKQAIDVAQSRISAVFGQKFHPKFPNDTRACDGRCGCGYYPTNTARYGHPGVDLKLAPTQEIVSPVAGLAKPAGSNSVSIEPATANFKQYEVILSNVRLSVQLSSNGTFVDAGQVLGTPTGSNGCDVSHLNVAVKRVPSDSNPSGQSYFVDPFPFLDIPQPAAGWQQECRDFTFKHIGNVVDFSKLTSNLASLFEELQRFAVSVGKGLLLKVIDKLPDTGFLGPLKSIASDIVQNIDLSAGSLKNIFSKGKGPIKNFFKNISAKKFNLKGLLNMTRNKLGTTLRNSLRNVTSLITKAKNFIRNPPLGALKSLAMGSVGRILASRNVLCARSITVDLDKMEIKGCGGSVLESVKQASTGLLESLLGNSGANRSLGILGKFGSKVVSDGIPHLASFVAGRVGMVSALKASGCSACPELGSALARVSGGTCLAHEDCLGMDCDVQFQNTLTKIQASVKVKVNPPQHQVTLEVNGQVQVLPGNLTKTVEKKIGEFTVRLKVHMSWQGTELQFTLSLEACVVGRCLPEVRIVRDLKIVAATRRRRALQEASCRKPMLDYLDSQPLDHVGKMLADTNLPTNSTNQQINGIQRQIYSALKPSEEHAQAEMRAEFLNPKDYLSSGKFPIAGEGGDLYIPFFAFMYAYPVGPLVLRMEFDAGGAIGLENKMKVRALDSLLQETIKPWVSGKFRASFSVSIVIASAGIDLIGWVMKTGFPLSMKTNFTQYPVISTKTLELELIPIELKLKLWASILFFINFEKTIWHYTAPAIRTTIWEKVYHTEDKDAPQFVQPGTASNGRRQIRSSGHGCTVYQVKGRHPKTPAFNLEFVVKDDNSALELSYAVGDYPGDTNVQSWTKLRSSLQSPAEFPCGIPLYFLVKARNTQGLEATASCSLPTFDCTFPDGRVDAAYRCSSHPSTLKSMVVMYEDSELQTNSLFHGVGYSPSSYGHEVVHWQALKLHNSQPRHGVSGDLRYFGEPRSGRMSSNPINSSETPNAGSCASQCVQMTTCVTFVYNKHLRRCELHQVTEGPNAERILNDHYETYERLGKSYTTTLRYENLELRHGTRYYVNVDVKNVLGYQATLSSQGTMIDRTPPEPGPVGKVKSDRTTAEGCGVSILQRCVEHVAGSVNHRKVIDGNDSKAIFNGNRKGQQMSFTIENYHAAANWQGFKDSECGIHAYMWAVGRSVCGRDVVSFVDPHALIRNRQDWTYTGLAKGLHLADGAYYVSVQAVNDVIHGGDLVTTVCHSTPFVVDTTPPQFHAVQEFLFDESFRFLVVYYNVSDAISGVGRMEFGLGKTKYDVMIRRYLPMEMRGVEGNTYLVNEEFETQDGVPAWIRLKVVNNVGLAATGSSIAPILIDSSPPIAGTVLDGKDLGQDKCCQMSTTEICAQWVDFHDPDSNIDSFDWGVGLSPGKDDVLQFHSLSAYTKQKCQQMTLQHNVTYFSTVVANNKALNTKSANASSDGLLIDITPPVPGKVSDGSDVTHDVNFTSETATVTTSWADFYDGESGLADYGVSVMVNGNLDKTFKGLNSKLEVFADHSFSLKHKDSVVVQLQANNRAGGSVTVATDGMLVDHSPPEMLDISTQNRSRYQLRNDGLDFVWNFTDPESGVGEYRCIIFQLHQGRKTKFWPQLSDYHPIQLNVSTPTDERLNLDSLSLQNGASYSIQVTAVNRARMATTHESKPVIVDTTPPVILSVTLTKPGEEEETNENGVVEHVDQEPLWISWSPHDTESDIKTSHVCIGLAGSPGCLSSNQYRTVDASSPPTLSFSNQNLQVSTEEKEVRYQAYIITFNNAGVKSTVAMAKPFIVLKANIAGTVLDGRGTEDVDFSNDKASIAISFSGFSSAACGVVGYEWGVGTSPFATDVLPYTDYGLVVDNAGKGFAQIHIMQTEGQKYYSTVRARTGARCHEPYIVSSSDGFTLDTTPPAASFRVGERKVMSEEVVYQTTSNHLDVLWKVGDASGVRETRLVQDFFGSSPYISPVPAIVEEPVSLKRNPSPGDSLFSALLLTDEAGNERTVRLPPVVWDITPPVFLRLNCSKAVSALYPLLHCSWDTVQESHSRLTKILIGLGNGPSMANLMNMTTVPIHKSKWSYDVHHLFGASKVKYFYVIVQAINAAGLKIEKPLKVLNDVSPPSVDDIIVVTSPGSGFHDVKQRCQTPQDYMEVLLKNLSDPESDLGSVVFALGTSKGRSDVVPFRKCRIVNGMYILENLALSPGAIIYVTARITNTVGLYVIVTSDAVVISPEPRLEVSDGPGETDTDGQFDVHVIQGRWRYTDPCPVLEALWSVRERDGQEVIKFTPIDRTGNLLYNDGVHLQNFKTYVNHIRIKDALNRSREAFSDGVTVSIRLPDTATVRDGLGSADMEFQRDTQSLSANWDTFGNPLSTLPSDQIIKYAAAVGTDRSQSTTRSDIHGFEDIALSTNITFYGLNLTAKTQTYYVTVRAYSAAESFVESSSNGIRVGYIGTITPGKVKVSGYQSSISSIRFSWSGFDSNMGITHYHAGVSSFALSLWDNKTHTCSQYMKNLSSEFDVKPLQALHEDTMAVLDGLSLKHGASYYITVLAADKMGHCAAAGSQPVVVDTTPPVQGKVRADGYDAGTVIFVHEPNTLTVLLEDLADPQSGVETVTVQLVSSTSCDPASTSLQTLIRKVEAKNQTTVSMRNLELKENVVYFLRVSVTNRASLTTEGSSLPLLLDTTPPAAGLVKLGKDWTGEDQTFLRHKDTVTGLVALQSSSSTQNCVTQEDLLREDARKNWKPVQDNFTTQCVQFDPTGLHVMVQHNPYLTGVDKGATQYGPLAWREGDYRFSLIPAVSKNIKSGVSLGSPSLQPPFSLQNDFCDPSNTSCAEDRNQTVKSGSLSPSAEYGIGLTFYTMGDNLRLLFWAQDFLQLKQTLIPLDFDPATVAANYTLRLRKRQESGNPLWEVTVLVREKIVTSVSGLSLPDDFVVTVYGWNVDDYFPPIISPFEPFRNVTVVNGVSIPVATRPLCSYGSAFRDSTSDVKEVWVGVSDSYNATSNVANYTLLKSFCLPCLHQCSSICSNCTSNRLSDTFVVMPLVLQGLRLQAGDMFLANTSGRKDTEGAKQTKNFTAWGNNTDLHQSTKENKQYQLPTYYLDVRVVDHSGLDTHVKSVGFVVDTSPPTFKSVASFNPAFSADVAILELGNKNTVGVRWEVVEDASSVKEVQVSLGTQPGKDDIVTKQAVAKDQNTHVFAGLLLAEGKLYYVTVEAVNTAGLRGKAWSNFTVHTSQPDLSRAKVRMENVTAVSVGNVTVGVMDSMDNLALDVDFDTSEVESYELAIGSAGGGKEDVFPRTVVGKKGTKKIVIIGGFVWRKEASALISLGDYTKKNMSSDDQPDPLASLFSMEPGRCLKIKVYGVTKARVAASMDRLVCRKRPGDVMLTADQNRHSLQLTPSGFSVDPANADPAAFRVVSKLKQGGLVVGVLTESDTKRQYGSSASDSFSTFVVCLNADSPTSRWLRKRVKATPGPNVFVSLVAEAEFEEDTQVIYTVPLSVHVPAGARVSLLVYNPVNREWEAPEEVCSVSAQTYNNGTRVLIAKLCPKLFSEAPRSGARRKKRSTPVFSFGPRMLTVAVITSSVPNQPPTVHNTSITLVEDGGVYNFTLTYTDPEGDDMTFWVSRQPGHGTADVTPDGKISYRPSGNYTGKDTIYVQGKEVLTAAQLALGMVPHVVSFKISVSVTDVNDPPDIFYVPRANSKELQQEVAVGPTAGNGLNMTVYREANNTSPSSNSSSPVVLGLVVFSDVDVNDTVHYASAKKLDAGVDFTASDVPSDDARLSGLNLTSATGISGKEISLTLTPQYTGHVQYHARVKDAAGSYSLQLTLNVFVLLNPCVHGVCEPQSSLDSCYEPRRAFTFDPYRCQCEKGYEGDWCQTETDECRTATCSPITDCVDLIGEYRCDVNTEKLAAIIVCCVLAVGLAALAIYKLKKRSSKVEPTKGSDDFVKPPPPEGNGSDDLVKPSPEGTLTQDPTQSSPDQLQDSGLNPSFQFLQNPLFMFNPRPNPTAAGPSAMINTPCHIENTTTTVKASVPESTAMPRRKPKTSVRSPRKAKALLQKISVHPTKQTSQTVLKGAKTLQLKTKAETVAKPGSVDGVNSQPTASSSTHNHYVITGATEKSSITDVE